MSVRITTLTVTSVHGNFYYDTYFVINIKTHIKFFTVNDSWNVELVIID